MTIPLSIPLAPFIPIILAWDSIVFYNEYREEGNCAYFREEGLYWASVSFQNALRSSLENSLEEN